MSKNLKRFGSYGEYESWMWDNPVYPNTCYITNVNKVMFNPVSTISSGYNLGDIILTKNGAIEKCPYLDYEPSDWLTWYKDGVIVIPTNHTDDGMARMISLNGVNSAGTAVSSNVLMPWGGYKLVSSSETGTTYEFQEVTGLTNVTRVPTWTNESGSTTYGSNSYGYLPSDSFMSQSGAVCQCDTKTKYHPEISSLYIPSPYTSTDGRNLAYSQILAGGNALSDFNGKENTAIITATTPLTDYEPFRPANACAAYSSNGFAAGEWYLPACGELGYLVPRREIINAALSKVGGVSVPLTWWWSSSQYSSHYACLVYTYDGCVYGYRKYSNLYVRPFCRVAAPLS